MKIIHVADIHIGTKFNKIDDDKKKDRLIDSLNCSFNRVVDFANENSIKTILLSGDIFDKDKVNKKDKEYFYSIIKGNPEIDFYYLKGNHDVNSGFNMELDNLHIFDNNGMYKKYSLNDNVQLIGYELREDGDNSNLYDMTRLNQNNYNILMLHGDISSSAVDHKIEINQLKDKNLNYLALGHIHTYQSEIIGKDTHVVYPGCLMGRGFDELGEKGFVVLDTKTNEHEFVHLPNKEFRVLNESVTEFDNSYELEQDLKRKIPENNNELLEIVLSGRRDFDINKDRLLDILGSKAYFLTIKDTTKMKLSMYEEYDERSLKGMFIKTVKEDDNLDESEKEEILRYGLSKIEKGDI